MHTRYALRAYESVGLETGVAGASPPQLVVMLHEGAVVAIRAARQHLQQGDIAAKGRAISKAISIIDGGLRASLDPKVGGPLAGNLLDLYSYMSGRLLEANIGNDGVAMDEVVQLLLQLKSAWETLAGQTDAGQRQGLDSGLRRNDGDLSHDPSRHANPSRHADPSRHSGEGRNPEGATHMTTAYASVTAATGMTNARRDAGIAAYRVRA